MNIRIAGRQDKDIWDAYVHADPGASPYALYAWKEAVEKAYGHRPCYLLAEEAGKIHGILPLILFRVPFRGASLISLPYCDI